MTREQAMELLAVIDFDRQPPASPELDEALALLDQDEQLRTWFEAERAFDDRIFDALQAEQVPLPDRAALCPRRRMRRRRMKWVGLGLLVGIPLLLLGAWSLLPKAHYLGPMDAVNAAAPAQLEDFRDFVTVYVANGVSLDFDTKDPAEAQAWLAEQQAPVSDLGPVLAAYKSMGCTTISWRGQVVSLLCFKSVDGHYIHLFRMDRGLCSGELQAMTAAKRVEHLERETAGWEAGNTVCILVAHKPGQALPTKLG